METKNKKPTIARKNTTITKGQIADAGNKKPKSAVSQNRKQVVTYKSPVRAKRKSNPVENRKAVATLEVHKERLAVAFYGLASFFYLIELFEKATAHIDLTTGLNFADNKFFNFGLQVVTIGIMLYRRRTR